MLLCFCLCKEEEMFVKLISQNESPLMEGGPVELPCAHLTSTELFCLHTGNAGSPLGTHFAELHSVGKRKWIKRVFRICQTIPLPTLIEYHCRFALNFYKSKKTSHSYGTATSFIGFADQHSQGFVLVCTFPSRK